MPSMITWLDASPRARRRMREIVKLPAQSESRDKLGIGQVRNIFSNSVLPFTSTLRTRAGKSRDILQKWAQECEANDGKLSACDRDAFWDFILAMNPQVRPVTRKFLARGSTGFAALSSPGRRRRGAAPAGRPPEPRRAASPGSLTSATGGLVWPVGHPPSHLPVGSGQQDFLKRRGVDSADTAGIDLRPDAVRPPNSVETDPVQPEGSQYWPS